MNSGENYAILMAWIATQADAYEKRAKSRIEIQYGDAMKNTAVAIAALIHNASFDQLLAAEKAFQKNDLTVYAQMPATLKSV